MNHWSDEVLQVTNQERGLITMKHLREERVPHKLWYLKLMFKWVKIAPLVTDKKWSIFQWAIILEEVPYYSKNVKCNHLSMASTNNSKNKGNQAMEEKVRNKLAKVISISFRLNQASTLIFLNSVKEDIVDLNTRLSLIRRGLWWRTQISLQYTGMKNTWLITVIFLQKKDCHNRWR